MFQSGTYFALKLEEYDDGNRYVHVALHKCTVYYNTLKAGLIRSQCVYGKACIRKQCVYS